jgi:hypothetical protein
MVGDFTTKSGNMEAYRKLAMSLAEQFEIARIGQHSRTTNSHADALATLASAIPSDLRRTIQLERLCKPSITQSTPDPSREEPSVYMTETNITKDWMDPFVRYLKDNILPEKSDKAYGSKSKQPSIGYHPKASFLESHPPDLTFGVSPNTK